MVAKNCISVQVKIIRFSRFLKFVSEGEKGWGRAGGGGGED